MKNGKKEKKTASGCKTDQEKRRKANKEITSMIYALMEPLCDSEGLELVHVEYQREASGRTLRIYIDKPGGVTLNDCSALSRQAGDMLDVCFEADESYNLEVSSPGFDRPLVKLQDFERFKGRHIKIRTEQPLNGQKNFTGILLGVFDDAIRIVIDNQTANIPFNEIAKARLAG